MAGLEKARPVKQGDVVMFLHSEGQNMYDVLLVLGGDVEQPSILAKAQGSYKVVAFDPWDYEVVRHD